jgi:aspartate dehydrogenase
MRICLIGYGAIGREIGAAVASLGAGAAVVGVLVRAGRDAGPFAAVHDVVGLTATRPDVVLECAGHSGVADYAAEVLAAGLDLVLCSVGALTDDSLVERLRAASASGGGRLLFAPGAVAGLDGLIAARLAGLSAVTYTSRKPPHAWRGTAAEAVLDLDHPEDERLFFEGTAREAARLYPKNANVAISVGLCGLGLDRTRVRLISSRKVTDPRGLIEAAGAFGSFEFDIFARASPRNPKSSALTAYSLLQCGRLGLGLPAFAFLDAPCE